MEYVNTIVQLPLSPVNDLIDSSVPARTGSGYRGPYWMFSFVNCI